MKDLLIEMIKAIVDKPDEVDITLTESENTMIYELRLGDGDVGKVIGKKGKTLTDLRPVGRVEIKGKTYQAFSHGDYINKDEKITNTLT